MLVSLQQRSTGLIDAGLAVHASDAVISEPALRAFAWQGSRNFRLLADTEHSRLPQLRRSRIGVAQTMNAAAFSIDHGNWLRRDGMLPVVLIPWAMAANLQPTAGKKKSPRPRSAGAIF
jgi:hypothetical protein